MKLFLWLSWRIYNYWYCYCLIGISVSQPVDSGYHALAQSCWHARRKIVVLSPWIPKSTDSRWSCTWPCYIRIRVMMKYVIRSLQCTWFSYKCLTFTRFCQHQKGITKGTRTYSSLHSKSWTGSRQQLNRSKYLRSNFTRTRWKVRQPQKKWSDMRTLWRFYNQVWHDYNMIMETINKQT